MHAPRSPLADAPFDLGTGGLREPHTVAMHGTGEPAVIEPTEHRTSPATRAARRMLLFLGATALFLLLSPLAAKADDGSSGLVDAVTGTVDEVTETATEALDDATDATVGTVEDVLDTAVETVEGIVETTVDTAELVAGDATGTVEQVADDAIDPRVGSAPPPPAGEDRPPVPDAVSEPPATDRPGDGDRRPTANEAGRTPAAALKVASEAHGRGLGPTTSGPPSAEPLVPRDPAGAGAASSASADSPTNLRVPAQGQDLGLTAALLLVALVLVRWSRREDALRFSPAFLSLAERPG